MPRRLDLTPYGLWPMAYGRWLMAYASCDISVSVATRFAESQDEGHAGATDRLALVDPSDMCVGMCADMHTGVRRACATHRRKARHWDRF